MDKQNTGNADFLEVANQVRISHRTIEETILRIEGTLRVYSVAKPLLRILQEDLFNHFQFQGREWFDELKLKFKDVHEQSKVIEFLFQDLKEVKIKSLIFFDDFPADMGDVRPVNFPKRFVDFSREILARFQIEENYLIPLLKKDKD